jgi:hypothetical protein
VTIIAKNHHVVKRVFALCCEKATGECGHDVIMVIDKVLKVRYNTYMMKTKRTARKDCNYVIYVAEHNGSAYIGLTRKGTVSVAKAVKERWRKHISRARHEDRAWELYKYIKSGNWDGWTHTVLDVIRGRAEAYAYERELVKHMTPELNDQYL